MTALVFSLFPHFLLLYKQTIDSPIKKLIAATKQLTEGKRNIKVLEKSSIVEIQPVVQLL